MEEKPIDNDLAGREPTDQQQSEAGEEASQVSTDPNAPPPSDQADPTDLRQQSEAASEAQPEPAPSPENKTSHAPDEERQDSEDARHHEPKWEHDEHPLTMLARLNDEMTKLKLQLRGITH